MRRPLLWLRILLAIAGIGNLWLATVRDSGGWALVDVVFGCVLLAFVFFAEWPDDVRDGRRR